MIVRSPIFRKLLLASVLLILATLASADFLLTRYTAERERSLVQQQMAQSIRVLAPMLPSVGPHEMEKWAEDADPKLRSRVTVIDSSGTVLADSRHDPESMVNHAGRPEVRAALAGHPGTSIRQSATLDVDFSYFAVRVELPGRGRAVLRLACLWSRWARRLPRCAS